MSFIKKTFYLVVISLGLLLWQPIFVLADTITVDTTVDEFGTNSGRCSLREAIQAANINARFGGCVSGSAGMDTVYLPTGNYILTLSGSGEYFNATGDLNVLTDTVGITLQGGGVLSSAVVIDANGLDRVIQATAALTLANLTLQNGFVVGDGGGAYFNSGNITNTTFVSNTAHGNGGGAYFEEAAQVNATTFLSNVTTSPTSEGGGAMFKAVVTLTNSIFSYNQTAIQGGGASFWSHGSITGTTFSHNTARFGGGGAFAVWGAVAVTNTIFSDNAASEFGGGGLFGGPVRMQGVTFSRNTAPYGGGAEFEEWGRIEQTTFLSNTASAEGGGVYVWNDSNKPMEWVNVLFSRNQAAQRGAAVYVKNAPSLALLHTTIAAPTPPPGAAQAVYVASGQVYFTNTIVAMYPRAIERAGGTVREDHNLFFSVTQPFSGQVVSGGKSLSGQNPLFVNPDADDYHLSQNSPAAGRGFPLGVLTDFDGATRSTTWPTPGYDEVAYLPPTLTLTDATGLEGSGLLVFTLTLSAASHLEINVTYATRDLTAQAGSDYRAASGLVTFTAGMTQAIVMVAITDDKVSEITETFSLVLSQPVHAILGQTTAQGTIIDDDGVVPQPQVKVLWHGQPITSGQTTPISLGTTYRGQALSHTLILQNLGDSVLTVTHLSLPPGITLLPFQPLSLTIAAQATQTWIMQWAATTPGIFTGNIQFNTNDPRYPLFTFPVKGEVKNPVQLSCLSLTILAPSAARPGQALTFTLRLVNSCGEKLFNLGVRFTLPSKSLRYDTSRDSLGWRNTLSQTRQISDSYEYTLGELALNQANDLPFPALVDPTAPLNTVISPTVSVTIPQTSSGDRAEIMGSPFNLTLVLVKNYLPLVRR